MSWSKLHPVGISSLQKKLYKSVLTKDLKAFEHGKHTSLNNSTSVLLELLCHSYVVQF